MRKPSKIALLVPALGLCLCALALVAAPADEGPAFLGYKACKKCHIKQYKTWAETKHAKAFECLQGEDLKKPECLKCHTTGFGKGGFVDAEKTPKLVNVQCEQCHGSGAEHVPLMTKLRKDKVAKDQYPKDKHVNRTPTGCTQCHNPHKKHAKIEKK